MVEIGYLVSAAVTGTLLVVVWAFVGRMENWRQYEPSPSEAGRELQSNSDSLAAWTVGFFLLALVAGGGAVLLVSDASFGVAVGSWVAVAVLFAALLLAYLLWGTYSAARYRGLPSAQAALLCAWVFGSLFVTAISLKLVLAG